MIGGSFTLLLIIGFGVMLLILCFFATIAQMILWIIIKAFELWDWLIKKIKCGSE